MLPQFSQTEFSSCLQSCTLLRTVLVHREFTFLSNCRVCGDRAIAHMHYGGICCYSCKVSLAIWKKEFCNYDVAVWGQMWINGMCWSITMTSRSGILSTCGSEWQRQSLSLQTLRRLPGCILSSQLSSFSNNIRYKQYKYPGEFGESSQLSEVPVLEVPLRWHDLRLGFIRGAVHY